tara:strand:+ start:297 stop:464 length:168 start_codon:yes stop_codon:yes gene_type:complete
MLCVIGRGFIPAKIQIITSTPEINRLTRSIFTGMKKAVANTAFSASSTDDGEAWQ